MAGATLLVAALLAFLPGLSSRSPESLPEASTTVCELRVQNGGAVLLSDLSETPLRDALSTLGKEACRGEVLDRLSGLEPPVLLVLSQEGCGIVKGRSGMLSGATLLMLERPMDINLADADDLQAISGIGPSLARAILAYREQQGRILNLDDLTTIRGIGPAKLGLLKQHCVVEK